MSAPKNNKEEDKYRVSLLPLDILPEMLCPAYEHGVRKYSRESWRMGFNQSVLLDSCMHHLTSFFYEREDYDPDYPEKHHLGAALFCIISMFHSWKNYPELDDRPGKMCSDRRKEE